MDEKKIFANRLNYYMEKSGKTQSDLIADLGVNKSTISTWCNGLKMPRMGTIQTLADYFGIMKSDLIEEKTIYSQDSIFDLHNIVPIRTLKIQLLGSISCGELKYADEDFEGYVECGTDIRADFALRAKGDSMINARINDGDIVFIRQQPTVEIGEIAAVRIGDDTTLKRFKRYGDTIVLHPENPSYDDIVIGQDSQEDIQIIGKAIAFQSDIK